MKTICNGEYLKSEIFGIFRKMLFYIVIAVSVSAVVGDSASSVELSQPTAPGDNEVKWSHFILCNQGRMSYSCGRLVFEWF